MRRIAWTEQQDAEFCTRTNNYNEQFESLQLEKYVLAKEKGSLEQQLKITTTELVV